MYHGLFYLKETMDILTYAVNTLTDINMSYMNNII